MKIKALQIAWLCILLLGAASCIRYHAKPISIDRSLADFESRSLTAPELKSFLQSRLAVKDWPPPSWDLQALTRVAIYYHPDLDVARAQWAVAKAGRVTAGERPNPTLSVLTGYNSTTSVSEVNPWIPEAALEIPVETAGKRGYRIAEARHLSEAARLNIISTAWEVRRRLLQSFLDLFAAQETEELLKRQQSIQAESLQILEYQLAAGEASAYDVTQARISANSSRLAELAAAEQLARSRVQLAFSLGLPVKALEGITFAFDDLRQIKADIPASDARRRALLGRADILGALSEYAASQSALQLEIAKQYPDINLGPDFQLDQTDNKWTLGLSLLLPIFSRNRGPIAEAEARRSESAARFLALQAQVVAEIESAVAGCRAAAQKAQAAEAMLAELEKQERAAKSRYEIGEISRVEWLGIRQEMAAAALSQLDARVKAQQAAAELENAMQSPLHPQEWILESPQRASWSVKERKNE